MIFKLLGINDIMIIIMQRYIPTLAGVRRILAISKGLGEKGVCVKIVFLSTSCGLKCEEQIPNVSFEYWGDSISCKNQFLGVVSSAWKLLFKLPKKEPIYYYGLIPLVMLLLSFHKRNYYHEFTEYPPFIFGKGLYGHIQQKLHIHFMRHCKNIFVISKRLKKYCVNRGVNEKNIYILNMLVDNNRFAHLSRNPKERYIAYCGNGENFKDGVDGLIKSFAIIAKKDLDIKLYLLGKGPQSDIDVQKEIIRENHLENRVCMLGLVSANEVPSILMNAEILALARPNNIQAEYGFPTKVGEYLLTGNPIVLTKVGELSDFLVDGETCFFAEPDNPEDFATKLLWLLTNEKEARKIGEKGKIVAQNNFNYKLETDKIIRLLK